MRFERTTVEVVAVFDKDGTINPKRIRMNPEHEGETVFVVANSVELARDRMNGNIMRVFDCEFMDAEVVRHLTLKFELDSMRWFLIEIK